jgi:hypothetical protein
MKIKDKFARQADKAKNAFKSVRRKGPIRLNRAANNLLEKFLSAGNDVSFVIQLDKHLTVIKLRDNPGKSSVLEIFTERFSNAALKKRFKVLAGKGKKRPDYEIVNMFEEPIAAREKKDGDIAQRVIKALNDLDYKNEQLIFVLPRSHATSRYLILPTRDIKEIENIISLQAPHYLPYSSEELITGYQLLFTDHEGYSHVNLTLVHREAVEPYRQIFKELEIASPVVWLSSYGICELFNRTEQTQDPVIVLDVSADHAEIAGCNKGKLVFSRFFKLDGIKENSRMQFVDEIKKTFDAYSKEVPGPRPKMIAILGDNEFSAIIGMLLKNYTGMEVKIAALDNVLYSRKGHAVSLLKGNDRYALIGLGIADLPESLNLMPIEEKISIRKEIAFKQCIRIAGSLLVTLMVLSLAVIKHLNNKTFYVAELKKQMAGIRDKVVSLEKMNKQIEQLRKNADRRMPHLDILYELHRVTPETISFQSIESEGGREIVLRGQSVDMDTVFRLVKGLSAVPVLKDFNINVRYATQRRISSDEKVQFEILCMKSK